MPAEEAENQVVVEYRGGMNALRPKELEDEIERVWSELLRSEEGQTRIGRALGIDSTSLQNGTGTNPFEVEQDMSGFDGVTLVVVIKWAAVNVIAPVLIGLAKDEVKARLEQLWRQVIKPAIEGDEDGDKLGDEIPKQS